MQVAQTLTPWSSLLYRYFYRRVEVSNIANTIDPEEIPLLSQPTLVSGFGLTYARDRRDNPGDADAGNIQYTGRERRDQDARIERQFLPRVFPKLLVLSLWPCIRFRAVHALRNRSAAGRYAGTGYSASGAFLRGGEASLRGFGLNQAGPRDPVTGFPIGGLALLVFNQELRFPMKLPFIGNRLGGTLFYDGGNVYSDVNHISFDSKPSPSAGNELNYFSHTVGFGIRYPTPIGPVRVDFAYQLNPAQYSVTPAAIPPNPPGPPQLVRLPHFQFFFNIGPVF